MSAHDRAMVATSGVVRAAKGRSVASGHTAVQIYTAVRSENLDDALAQGAQRKRKLKGEKMPETDKKQFYRKSFDVERYLGS